MYLQKKSQTFVAYAPEKIEKFRTVNERLEKRNKNYEQIG